MHHDIKLIGSTGKDCRYYSITLYILNVCPPDCLDIPLWVFQKDIHMQECYEV